MKLNASTPASAVPSASTARAGHHNTLPASGESASTVSDCKMLARDNVP